MVVRVIRAAVVSNPLAIGVDVRSFGMSGRAECTMFRGRLCGSTMNWMEQVRVQEVSLRRNGRRHQVCLAQKRERKTGTTLREGR
jgi:hypothetical protein